MPCLKRYSAQNVFSIRLTCPVDAKGGLKNVVVFIWEGSWSRLELTAFIGSKYDLVSLQEIVFKLVHVCLNIAKFTASPHDQHVYVLICSH